MIKIMQGNYLFPHSYRKYGAVLFGLMLLCGIFLIIHDFELDLNASIFAIYSDEFMGEKGWFRLMQTDIGDELVSLGLIASAVLVAFSKEKVEDEFIASIRLRSLVWATYVNYGVLAFSIAFIYGTPFLHVMIYNMFTLLLIFIIKYRWSIYKWRNSEEDEE